MTPKVGKRGPKANPETRRSEIVQTRGTVGERARWEEAARHEDVTLSEQIRALLNRWAHRVLASPTRGSK